MKARLILLGSLAVLLLAPEIRSAEPRGAIELFLGQKRLDTNDWDPVDTQPEFGIRATLSGPAWPVSIAADLSHSKDDATVEEIVELSGETWELRLGARKVWSRGRFHPGLGAGLAFVRAEAAAGIPGDIERDSDSGTGLWLEGAAGWDLARRFRIGLALGYSRADVTIAGEDGAAGGVHLGLVAGWHWPSR